MWESWDNFATLTLRIQGVDTVRNDLEFLGVAPSGIDRILGLAREHAFTVKRAQEETGPRQRELAVQHRLFKHLASEEALAKFEAAVESKDYAAIAEMVGDPEELVALRVDA